MNANTNTNTERHCRGFRYRLPVRALNEVALGTTWLRAARFLNRCARQFRNCRHPPLGLAIMR